MSIVADSETAPPVEAVPQAKGPLIYRQSIWTRVTHWVWTICLFFLLLSGLQIFNAHPTLYVGEQSSFPELQGEAPDFDARVLSMYAQAEDGKLRGFTEIFGHRFETTGVLGLSGAGYRRGFPAWATIPSTQDLATGRVVHFFFGWVLVATLFVWFAASLINGHFRRDIVPVPRDITGLPGDIADHARLRFRHGRSYSPLQKLAYAVVLFILFPMIILTGLTMSPGLDAAWPWLLDLFGGRQTARTLHFATMALLVAFFIVHVVMVVVAGPFNGLRSMITGRYRTSPGTPGQKGDRP